MQLVIQIISFLLFPWFEIYILHKQFRNLKVVKYPMSLEELYKELSNINVLRENRLKYANMVLEDMSLFPKLMDILFMVDDKVSCKTAWV